MYCPSALLFIISAGSVDTTPIQKLLALAGTTSDVFCGEWNVFASDLFNEPSVARWNTRGSNDWGEAAGRLGNAVLQECPYYYFQSIEGADAHDNTADGIYARNSGNASLHGLPCNATTTNRCTNVVDVPINAPWPAAAQAIIANSGPRPRVIRSQRIVST